MLTIKQEQHLQRIKDRFEADVDAKYRSGAREHGGTLLEHDALWLLEEGMKEAVDQYVYLATLREKLLDERQR